MAEVSTASARMTTCVRCRKRWGGVKTAHCTACHETFTTVANFDRHRAGSHAASTRHCIPPSDVGLIAAGRAYPCWGMPGRNEPDDAAHGGDDDE